MSPAGGSLILIVNIFNKYFFLFWLATGFFIMWLPDRALADQSITSPRALVPDRGIIVEGQEMPTWKSMWDEARRLAATGEYDKAVRQYESLLVVKNNLEEARWELARLQMHLKNWNQATAILEILLEIDAERVEYLNSLGRVMWESGKFERAVDLFGKAHEKDSADQTALAGLVEGLIKLERKDEALPFLEQLNRIKPDNPAAQRYLAIFTFELGLYEKAKQYLAVLAEKKDVDLELLLKTAQVHDRLGQAKLAVPYWQRYLARVPDSADAHRRLAEYYEKNDQPENALPHLSALLALSKNDLSLYPRLGRAYEKTGQLKKALKYYQDYLSKFPKDEGVLRSIIKIQAAAGEKENVLDSLDKYFTTAAGAQPADLKLAARLYDAAGRYHKAVPIYKQLIDISPGDPEILEAMISDLLAIGENDGVLSVWQYLAEIDKPVRLSIYRSMADLLSRLSREGELLEVLERINELDPADEKTILQLALLYIDRGETTKAVMHFDELEKAGQQSADFFLGRGRLYQKMNQAQKALSDYSAFLDFSPERQDIRLTCIELAGILGRFALVEDQLRRLAAAETKTSGDELAISKGRALAASGFFQEAAKEYRTITDRTPVGAVAGSSLQTWLEMAVMYRAAGLDYEAEQVLRQALSREQDFVRVVTKLFDQSVERGLIEDSKEWLYGLQQHQLFKQMDSGVSEPAAWQLQLYKVRAQAAAGELRAAIRTGRHLYEDLQSSSPPAAEMILIPGVEAPVQQVGLELCRLLFKANRLFEAEELAGSLLVEAGDDLELLVLLELIYKQIGEPEKGQDLLRLASDRDLLEVLRLASLYMAYGNMRGMHKAALQAVEMAPDSIKAQFLLAAALEKLGRIPEALAIYKKVAEWYPDNNKAAQEIVRLLFMSGQYDEALLSCEKIIERQGLRPEILLLKARILWAQQRWKDAIVVYQAFLEPSLDSLLAALLKDKGLSPDLSADKGFWERITFRDRRQPGLAAIVMSPAHAVDRSAGKQEINRLVADYFARYVWQERFAREMSARVSILGREYFNAVKQFEYLVRDYGRDESLLFDLAGVYSRLGMLSEESDVYEELLSLNPAYPGVQEAVHRNRLKQRPRFALAYNFREEDGWNNYKDIREERADASFWLSPLTSHETEMSVSRIRYKSVNNGSSIWSKRAFLSHKVNLSKELLLTLGGGAENLDKDNNSTGIFNWSLQGKLGDEVEAWAAYQRGTVADTLASLSRNISSQKIKGGAEVDLLPRLVIGGEYGHIDYSDENQGSSYSLWTSYIVFAEPTFLRLGYKYDFYDTRYGVDSGGPTLADGFAADDHPYWCPRAYSQNRFSLFFKHILADDYFGRGISRYYTVDYNIGYDARGYDLHSLKGDFVVELNRHIIVNASGGVFSLQDYHGNEFSISVAYRW